MGACEVDPLGPDNPLMIMQGPLSGTTLPGRGRLEELGLPDVADALEEISG